MSEKENIPEEQKAISTPPTASENVSSQQIVDDSSINQSEILKSKIKEMEVHHHSDLHHKPKAWKEYFLEFLMIFLAVTLGFFAESDRAKEKEYMQSMIEDLGQDTIHLHEELIWESKLINGLDSIRQIIYAGKYNEGTIRQLYLLNPRYVRPFGVEFVDRTPSQLKNAGGLRLIHKEIVTDHITAYWGRIGAINRQVERAETDRSHALQLLNRIFYTKYYDDEQKIEDMHFNSPPKLLNNDTALLAEYANYIFYIRVVLRSFLSPTVKDQLKAAGDLITLIKKEYDLK